jgi:hypothetical protein
MRSGVALALAAALAGCGGMPRVDLPGAGAWNRGTEELVEDRVWIDTGEDAAPGSVRLFLSDGTLLMTSCGETWRLAPWRWVDEGTLVWEEETAVIRAEVALAGPRELVLVLDLADGPVTRTYRWGQAPEVCR